MSWSGTPVRLASGHTGDIVALATQAPPPVTAANGGLYASTCRLALTCGGSERSVRVWDTTSWDQVVQFQVGDDAAPTAVSLAAPQSVAGTVTPAAYGMLTSINARFPNVTWAAVGQDNGVVRLFRLDAVACVAEVCPGVPCVARGRERGGSDLCMCVTACSGNHIGSPSRTSRGA